MSGDISMDDMERLFKWVNDEIKRRSKNIEELEHAGHDRQKVRSHGRKVGFNQGLRHVREEIAGQLDNTQGGQSEEGETKRNSELKNPMRFSVRNRRINIKEKLRHPDFNEKQVTEIEIQDGQLYVRWERSVQPGNKRSKGGNGQ